LIAHLVEEVVVGYHVRSVNREVLRVNLAEGNDLETGDLVDVGEENEGVDWNVDGHQRQVSDQLKPIDHVPKHA